ncbi:metallophosphoesterase [Draconibacterium orientale]|uniref:metallophosphoesterase n=1 Tax=Draconibacterium orientale TaxID=1168034 RepID=UPI002A0A4544|nr:metallophosphoesterase [Draconibacterium orientale]
MKRIEMKLLTVICLFALIFQNVDAQEIDPLRFKTDGTFKIAQFTDVHWSENSENCEATSRTIKMVLENEQPDLVILTGDIVTDVPAKQGWLTFTKTIIDAGVPWAVTLGNHDAEPGISREEIFDLLETLPNFIGEKGPELTGCGNYTLPILSSKGNKTRALVYCFDSNSYSTYKKISNYDWVHFDQINWYRNESQKANMENNGAPLPALAFLHIPLPEYDDVIGDETIVGVQDEGVASAKINSGLFASMLEMRDVMGVFAGHDHDNNYIGINKDIALAFGQVTGSDAYGKLERGSRIIQLTEGDFSFDTWIRTADGITDKYNYPAGLLHDDPTVTYHEAVNTNTLIQGVAYRYFEGDFGSVNDLSSAEYLEAGTIKNFTLEKARKEDYFAFEYNAYLKIDKKGVYRFFTYSDDGSQLFIDEELVVDNDGSHSASRKDGSIALEAGYHKIKLLYFESYMGEEVKVGISGISIRETLIPNSMLFIEK